MSEFDWRCHWIIVAAKFLVFSLFYQTLTYLSEGCARGNLIFAPGSKRIARALGFDSTRNIFVKTSFLSEASRNLAPISQGSQQLNRSSIAANLQHLPYQVQNQFTILPILHLIGFILSLRIRSQIFTPLFAS